jgi:acyl-CoA dehydrogenase
MNELVEPFVRLLQDIFSPAAIRAIENGKGAATSWEKIEASGYLDALLPEAQGGVGLPLSEAQPLWQALGYYAVPLPVGETMVARYLLALDSAEVPTGAVALATGAAGWPVCSGDQAEHWLVESAGRLALVPKGEQFMAASDGGALRRMAASLRASQIAGAAARLTEMTAAYANERVQFGKPIGKQQALQQNMAQMAEDMVACRIAAQLCCLGGGVPSLARVATAKSITSTAAPRIAATAHAVHGAIGISEEYDLQLYSRLMQSWRWADGAESYWNSLLGEARLTETIGSVDFARSLSAPDLTGS